MLEEQVRAREFAVVFSNISTGMCQIGLLSAVLVKVDNDLLGFWVSYSLNIFKKKTVKVLALWHFKPLIAAGIFFTLD